MILAQNSYGVDGGLLLNPKNRKRRNGCEEVEQPDYRGAGFLHRCGAGERDCEFVGWVLSMSISPPSLFFIEQPKNVIIYLI